MLFLNPYKFFDLPDSKPGDCVVKKYTEYVGNAHTFIVLYFQNITRDRQVYFALVTCFCACAQKQRIPLVKKIIITSLIVKLKI